MTKPTEVRAAYIPLLDCAPLVVAGALGFAEAEGLRLTLSRETSWATLRDRISVRHLDAAHMLAPMPIAANLGLTPLPTELVAPLSLGAGGNTITMSLAAWDGLRQFEAPADFDARRAIDAFSRLVEQRRHRGAPKLMIGIVHPHSVHFYQLAYWLSAGQLEPQNDIDLVVLPPSLMPAALATGQIDGFCAGEPWGSVAVADGAGKILTTSAHIWRNGPEKVLGVRKAWAESKPEAVAALIRAVYRAALWCDEPANRGSLAELLSKPEHLAQSATILRRSLERRLVGPPGSVVEVEGFLTFSSSAATFPWVSQAAWLYAQMVRWGQLEHSPHALSIAKATFRPDMTRAALASFGAPLPLQDSKIEGAIRAPMAVSATHGTLTLQPDQFFDGGQFDPDHLEDDLARSRRDAHP